MKTLKYTLASLTIALFVAGCASGSGVHNFDTYEKANQEQLNYGK